MNMSREIPNSVINFAEDQNPELGDRLDGAAPFVGGAATKSTVLEMVAEKPLLSESKDEKPFTGSRATRKRERTQSNTGEITTDEYSDLERLE